MNWRYAAAILALAIWLTIVGSAVAAVIPRVIP